MTPHYSLNPSEIKVWYVRPEDFKDPALLEVFFSWISDAERDVLNKFRLEKHRHTYLVAHALLRGALSHTTGHPPTLWQFSTNAYNKPFIAQPHLSQALQFNLSHTDGLAVVCVTRMGVIGIDVERINQNVATSELAPEILSPEEYLDYVHQPEAEKQNRLLRYWTLKEAYIKATGLGLSAGLKTYAFDLDVGPQPKIRFLNEKRPDMLSDCPSNWKFWQTCLQSGHILAVGSYETSSLERSISIEQAAWLEENHALR